MHWKPTFEYSIFWILDKADGFLLDKSLAKWEKNVDGGYDEKWIITLE